MNERDHELIAARRTCALLSRDDIAEGKVPTTATTSGVVAGIQVQEAIKLLHRERLGTPTLAGAGFHFVGLTHDSYVVRYPRREECLSHDTYDVEDAEVFSPTAPFAELVAWAERQLGVGTVIELEHEIVVAGDCTRCGVREEILRPVPALDAGRGLCFECLEPWRLEFAHAIDRDSPLIGLSAVDLDLPPEDVVVARAGADRVFVRLAPVAVDAGAVA